MRPFRNVIKFEIDLFVTMDFPAHKGSHFEKTNTWEFDLHAICLANEMVRILDRLKCFLLGQRKLLEMPFKHFLTCNFTLSCLLKRIRASEIANENY